MNYFGSALSMYNYTTTGISPLDIDFGEGGGRGDDRRGNTGFYFVHFRNDRPNPPKRLCYTLVSISRLGAPVFFVVAGQSTSSKKELKRAALR